MLGCLLGASRWRFSGTNWDEIPGQSQNLLVELHISPSLGCRGIPQAELVSISWEREVWNTILSILQPQLNPGQVEENIYTLCKLKKVTRAVALKTIR